GSPHARRLLLKSAAQVLGLGLTGNQASENKVVPYSIVGHPESDFGTGFGARSRGAAALGKIEGGNVLFLPSCEIGAPRVECGRNGEFNVVTDQLVELI